MILLVSLEEAKIHLRITDNDRDSDIEMKLAAASSIVLQHAKLDSVPAEWLIGSPPEISAPGNIQAATLLALSELFENREAGISNPLSNSVKSIIPRYPTLA